MSYALFIDTRIAANRRQQFNNAGKLIQFTHILYSDPDSSVAANIIIGTLRNTNMEFLGYIPDLPEQFTRAADQNALHVIDVSKEIKPGPENVLRPAA